MQTSDSDGIFLILNLIMIHLAYKNAHVDTGTAHVSV